MTTENELLVEKTISTTDMSTGGLLQPVQQDAFVQLVKDNSTMLREVRFEQMAIAQKLIDKAWIGEPISRGIAEAAGGRSDSAPVFEQVTLNASKLKTDWSISTETLQENIEQDGFEDTLMTMMTKRIATDMELLAVQGVAAVGGTTPNELLLQSQDGWATKTDSAHIVDAGGVTITKGLFANAIREMPEQYLQDPDLKWIMSRTIATDWQETVSDRATAAGDQALMGSTMRPYGYDVLIVPSIPSRLDVTVGVDSAAIQTGDEFGPYEVKLGDTDTVRITTNLSTIVEIVLTAGVYTAVQLAVEINTQLLAGGAQGILAAGNLTISDDGQGRVVFTTVTTGAGATVTFTDPAAGAAASLLAEIGIATATTATGTAGAAGVRNEGSFIWLANPKNFIFGMVDSTRLYTEFNKDADVIETTVYNQLANAIENLDAIVKITNVRRGT